VDGHEHEPRSQDPHDIGGTRNQLLTIATAFLTAPAQKREVAPISILAEAAAACGIKKSTILRAIKTGKVSAIKGEHDEWRIEPVECQQLNPPERR
jgi:hypothetical protein